MSTRSMSEEDASNLLVIVLDTNPVWWGQRLLKQDGNLLLSQCINSVLVFANSHLMMSHKNRLALVASHTNSSRFLYPKPVAALEETPAGADKEEEISEGQRDGQYELFTQVDDTIRDQIQDLILTETRGELYSDSLVAGAMAMGLCYINRIEKENEVGEKLSSRILLIKGSEDNPSQYMNFMNVVFTAQKQNVVVDACVLDNDSGLLQQACDITSGIYLKVPQMSGLLQYLLVCIMLIYSGEKTLKFPQHIWVFLPAPLEREKMTLPPRMQVDYRAACFCHRNLIEIGYVCSVCLSIFCSFSPICSTCHTTFKFLGPPKALKRKSKKSS